jgi:hypothetical protein
LSNIVNEWRYFGNSPLTIVNGYPGRYFVRILPEIAVRFRDYRPLSKQANESKAPPAKEIQLLNWVMYGMAVSEPASPTMIRITLIHKVIPLGEFVLMVKYSLNIFIQTKCYSFINFA